MTKYPDTKETVQLIKQLVSIPSPTGYTEKIIHYIERFIERLQVPYYRTNKGALVLHYREKMTQSTGC